VRHVLFSFHTCPLEEPGTGLAGGMNVFLRGLLSGLGKHGIETDVLTRGKGSAVEITRPYRGVRVVHVPCGWEEPPSREAAFRALPRFIEKAGEILRERGAPPHALSAHYWMSGLAALEAWAWKRPPGLVFSFHTVETLKPMAATGRSHALSVARRSAEERIAREANRVVFLSEHDLAATGETLPAAAGKGVVIPPGVDDAFRRPPPREEGRREFGIPAGAFLFLLAARPDAGKNVPAAVEAFLAVRETGGREAHLLVAGQGPPAGTVPGGVIFAGAVSHETMPALLSAADAVLCPSTYESFGLVPLEAMAGGIPVIVPRDGYWGNVVSREGGGAVYAPESPRGLPGAMMDIMRQGAARTRMAAEGKRIAARFTWESCTESWAGLLSSGSTHGSRRGTPRAPAAHRRRSSARPDAS
jgi:D-inositol-3-phosphate glycosyltransferase